MGMAGKSDMEMGGMMGNQVNNATTNDQTMV
jgi:hypothetical protein